MNKPLTIRKVGNSLSVTISDFAKELGLGEGDKLFAVRTPQTDFVVNALRSRFRSGDGVCTRLHAEVPERDEEARGVGESHEMVE